MEGQSPLPTWLFLLPVTMAEMAHLPHLTAHSAPEVASSLILKAAIHLEPGPSSGSLSSSLSLQLGQAQSDRVGRLPPSHPVEDRPHRAGQPAMWGRRVGGDMQLPPLPVQAALAWTMWLCGDFPRHLASEVPNHVPKNFWVWGQSHKRQNQGHA